MKAAFGLRLAPAFFVAFFATFLVAFFVALPVVFFVAFFFFVAILNSPSKFLW